MAAVATVAVLAAVGFLPQQSAHAVSPDHGKTVSAPLRTSPVVDVRQFGAACNGVTDDSAAFNEALQALADAGGGVLRVPAGRCRVVQTPSSVFIGVPSAVTIQGEGNRTQIALDCSADTPYAELFRVAGHDITIRDLQLVRTGPCDSVMIAVHAIHGFALRDVTIRGDAKHFRQFVHGVMLTGVEGPSSNLTLDRVHMRDLDYGLFQPSSVTQVVSGITVKRSRFVRNQADDLEFNAPEGRIQRVTVTKSVFRNNRSRDEGSGFGVGLANVHHARITSNEFVGYAFEPVHIEDRSTNVTVRGNRFRRSFTTARAWASHVFIINDSRSVRVIGNVFDTRSNCNHIQAVFVNPGGTNLPAPSNVTVRGNVLFATRTAQLAYHDGVLVHIEGNRIRPEGKC
jgi:hypothetical protein